MKVTENGKEKQKETKQYRQRKKRSKVRKRNVILQGKKNLCYKIIKKNAETFQSNKCK